MSILVDGLGRITVVLGGGVFACSTEDDCPFQSTCVKGAPWSALPAMCVCPIEYSRSGSRCNDLSPEGFGMLALVILTLVVACITLGFASYDIYLMRQASLMITWTAVQTSLLFLALGSLGTIIAQLSLIGETFADLKLVTRAGGVIKRGPDFFPFTNICVALALLFGQLGMLNVCLVWLEVTDIRRKFSGNIRRFRNPVILCTIIYTIVYSVLVGLDSVVILAYFSIPGFVLIIAGYVIGYFKLSAAARRKERMPNTVLRTSGTENPVFGSDVQIMGLLGFEPGTKPRSTNRLLKEKRREDNLKKKLRNVANIAISLVSFATLLVVMLLVTAGLAGSNDTPLLSTSGFLYRSCFVCFASCLLTVMIYVHQQVCVLVGKKSRFITSQSSLSSRFSTRKSMKKKASASALVKHHDEKTGMSEILKRENPELRTKFTEFVRSKYADEPLVFYDACSKYQEAAKGSHTALKGRSFLLVTLGHQIIDKFIKEDSVKWVNVSDVIRRELLQAASNDDFNEHTFDKAKVMAFELLKQNFYHQFVKILEEEDEDNDILGGEDVIHVRNMKDLNV